MTLVGAKEGRREGVGAVPSHTHWLAQALRVSGPAGDVEKFRAAAVGAAAIPWELDLDIEEERLLAPMATLGVGARILARELRDAVAAHHARVLAQVETGRVCPLDLHQLIPVPARVLRLGPDDPASLRWLQAHWGTSQALRHVRVLDGNVDRRRRRTAVVTYAFYSADWSPWQALLQLRAEWPSLVFELRPEYGDGGG